MKGFRKQGFFALGLAVIVLISVESVAQLFYFASYGKFYSPGDLLGFAAQDSSPDDLQAELAGIAQRRILHP